MPHIRIVAESPPTMHYYLNTAKLQCGLSWWRTSQIIQEHCFHRKFYGMAPDHRIMWARSSLVTDAETLPEVDCALYTVYLTTTADDGQSSSSTPLDGFLGQLANVILEGSLCKLT